MITLRLERDPLAVDVQTSETHLQVALADSRVLRIPLDWYPRLQDAKPAERGNWRLLGNGYAIEWPDLDEHIGVEGLIAGRKSSENSASFNAWRKERMENDPLIQLAGIIDNVDIPDLADEHDKYLNCQP